MNGAHAFLPFGAVPLTGMVVELCQSFAIDNGAFSAWKRGAPITDWKPFYEWAANCLMVPSCDFAVIPDVIDGDEAANDALVDEWPLPKWFGAPVWHMHETLQRLKRLARDFPRVCIGSSGEFSSPGNDAWWSRMGLAMATLCDADGRPMCRLHGLRMLSTKLFSKLPLASADSTNIARNIGIDLKWKGTYQPPSREVRASVLRARIEAHNAPSKWDFAFHEHQPTEQGVLL